MQSIKVDGATPGDIFYSENEVISISEFVENQVHDAQIKRTLLKLPNIFSKLRKAFTLIQKESENIVVGTERILSRFSRQAYYQKVRILELEAENKSLRQRLRMNNLPHKQSSVNTAHPYVICDCPAGHHAIPQNASI